MGRSGPPTEQRWHDSSELNDQAPVDHEMPARRSEDPGD